MKKMFSLTLCLLLLCTIHSSSAEDLIGSWKLDSSSVIQEAENQLKQYPQDENIQYILLSHTYSDSYFIFQQDGTLLIKQQEQYQWSLNGNRLICSMQDQLGHYWELPMFYKIQNNTLSLSNPERLMQQQYTKIEGEPGLLIGKWGRVEDGLHLDSPPSLFIDIQKDGTYISTFTDVYTYNTIDHLLLRHIPDFEEPDVFHYEISGDQLILSVEDTPVLFFNRYFEE